MILDYQSRREAINASRDKAMAVATAENRILCRALGRWKLFCDARDVSVMPYLAMDGIYEPDLVELLTTLVRPGMVCCDVGACFGFSTMVIAQSAGQSGRVFAFEPHPRCFSMLKSNLEINGFVPAVRPYPNAVGDQDTDGETGKLAIHKRRYGGATMSEKAKASFGAKDNESEPVKVSKLDTIMAANHAEPDFYLISTEGYEPQVWAGMKQLLKAKRKITVVMEFTPRWYADAMALANDMMNEEGFSVSRLQHDKILVPLTAPEQFIGKFQSYLVLNR